MEKMSILIVDDIVDFRDYFKMIIEKEADMEVVGTAESGKEACEMALKFRPDIILMDIQMEYERAGIEAIKKIKEIMEDIKIIVLTIHKEEDILFQAYASGAMDYILKESSIVDIIQSIRNVYKNRISLRPGIAEKIIQEFTRLKNEQNEMVAALGILKRLTNTEFEVLKAKYEGYTYKQIAAQRCVEDVTVRIQGHNILKKFNKGSIEEVVEVLRKLRFFEYSDLG